MAERVGFEPTVGLHLRLISSQVHSTTLPPLREARIIPAKRRSSQGGKALPKLLRLICCLALSGLAACTRIEPPETEGKLVVAVPFSPPPPPRRVALAYRRSFPRPAVAELIHAAVAGLKLPHARAL